MRRAHERAMQRAGHLDVGDETPAPEQETAVLDTTERRADALVVPRAHSISSRTRSSASKADLSVTMKRSASPPLASWRAQVQCGMVKTSCCDDWKLCPPMNERPSPATTRQRTW